MASLGSLFGASGSNYSKVETNSADIADIQSNVDNLVSSMVGMRSAFPPTVGLGTVHPSWIPENGAQVSKTMYPLLWAWVKSQPDSIVTETNWNILKNNSGTGVVSVYGGDTSTDTGTFRLPDTRGSYYRSLKGNETVSEQQIGHSEVAGTEFGSTGFAYQTMYVFTGSEFGSTYEEPASIVNQVSVNSDNLVKKFEHLINVKDYGAIGDGVNDDTVAIQTALLAGDNKIVLFPEGTYIYEPATNAILETDIRELIINGDIQYIRHGLRLENNNIKIHGTGSISREFKTTDTTINFQGNYFRGTNVHVEGLTFENSDGYNLACDLKQSLINNCNFASGQIGLFLSPNCSYLSITHCNIYDNNVTSQSGADGINSQRNVDNLTVMYCNIYNNGEHGVYYQGDNGIFAYNKVYNNHADGLKFGSYNTNLSTEKANNLRVFSRDGLTREYGGYNIEVYNNIITNNIGGDGIYFQPSYDDVEIKDNILYGNGIRTVFFNYNDGSRLEEIKRVRVTGNHVKGSTSLAYIDIAASFGTVIKDNKVDGYIRLYAADSGNDPAEPITEDAIIEGNVVEDYIQPGRSNNATIFNNVTPVLQTVSNSSNYYILNNTITEQDEEFDTARIYKFNNNKVNMTSGIRFNDSGVSYSFPYEFKENEIIGDYTGSYFINSSTNANKPTGGIFSNNNITSTSSTRMIRIEGQECIINGNVLMGGTQDIAIDVFGDNCVLNGNYSNSGTINLRNDSSNVVVGNGIPCNDIQPTNVVSGNLP